MARYAIYCYEQLYSGLHGMNVTGVIEASSDKEADESCYQISLEVIESYECIRQTFSNEALETLQGRYYAEDGWFDDEFYSALQELYEEDVAYEWALIDEELAGNYSTKELDSMAYDMGYEEFVEAYCSYTS